MVENAPDVRIACECAIASGGGHVPVKSTRPIVGVRSVSEVLSDGHAEDAAYFRSS